ncbi:unnamed protein product [Lactuca virosa]|uniref:EDR1/CTR1/ARMC3-like peptidase-like domain-containing protein n=1 Tax=Lactuca virosa TaxID=75947 RepID=A0AAU9LRP0_9ASTR|nr:unnamed protein product [Lactuca virosa]
MSKMKHLLRKLHIGGGFNDNNNRLATADPSSRSPATTTFHSSSSSPSMLPIVDGTGADLSSSAQNVNDISNSSTVDSNFFEEEFQMQLALAISVSSGSVETGQPDAETEQIKAAKQRSLGCSPSEPFVEFLSLRYWSNNVVNYDEKVMDGFYDVYGITSSSITQGKMPLLVDLQAITVSDNVDYEVILVDRMVDKELRYLEERVSTISLECQAAGTRQIMSTLIQKLANIVVAQMGGPVSDADEMLRRWTLRSYELRNSMNTIILPLGCLDVGLSRHRALLFKVLADKINLPCSLVKGSYYTGTDDGAVNLIKIDNGSEYIIDLMGAPGTLIPSEVQSYNLPNFGLDSVAATPQADNVAKIGTSGSEVTSSSIIGSQSKGLKDGKVMKRKSNGEIEDVSECVITAAKNPEFAQKLHAVLLNNGGTSLDSLLNVNNQVKGEADICETVHLLDADMLNVGGQHGQVLVMSNHDNTNATFFGLQTQQEVMSKTDILSESTCESHNEGISLTAVEWEILWEDLQIGERIGIGEIQIPLFTVS